MEPLADFDPLTIQSVAMPTHDLNALLAVAAALCIAVGLLMSQMGGK